MVDNLLTSNAVTVDRLDATATLERTAPRFAALIRKSSNPAARAIGDWSVRDVAVHIEFVLGLYRDILNGNGSQAKDFDDAAREAQHVIDSSDQRDLAPIADGIEAGVERFVAAARAIDGDPVVPYVGGIPVATSCVVATVLGELLVHGYDIARASDLPWDIDAHAAALTLKGISAITVHFVNEEAARGIRARYDIGLRGETHMHYVFDDGTLTIEEPSSARVDVRISADPVTLLLMGYGRIGPTKPALTGKLLAYGRKPWLAMKMPALLRNP